MTAVPVAVEVANLSKRYSLARSQAGRFRHVFFPSARRPAGPDPESVQALSDVSFSVAQGETFGIVGENGSGKSTLLQIIAGILRPGSGYVTVNGRLSSLLALGAGFSPEFTGRENVFLNGALHGLSQDEIASRFAAIERFAEIGDFIDQPVRTYSSGMMLRLAFAVTAHVDAEILIVDEALAVGDIAFRQRCMRRIHELRDRGATILFVSHEASDVKSLCQRCLWLSKGVPQHLGEAGETIERYLAATRLREREPARRLHHAAALATGQDVPPGDLLRHGDGRIQLTGARLVMASGLPARSVKPHDHVKLRARFTAIADVPSPIVGFIVRNARGENVFGTNTARENYPMPPLSRGAAHAIEFDFAVPEMEAGRYSIAFGLADGDLEEYTMCDFLDGITPFTLSGHCPRRGYFRIQPARVEVHSH